MSNQTNKIRDLTDKIGEMEGTIVFCNQEIKRLQNELEKAKAEQPSAKHDYIIVEYDEGGCYVYGESAAHYKNIVKSKYRSDKHIKNNIENDCQLNLGDIVIINGMRFMGKE